MNDYDTSISLFYTFRYALGRMTYAVGDAAELLVKYKHTLDDLTKNQIKKEIHEAIIEGRAGMEMDVAIWRRVLELI
jgi:hypothetical protein